MSPTRSNGPPITIADLKRAPLVPRDHQVVGVDALVRWDDTSTGRIIGGCFFLTDEMGAGKTKQIIDAAQVLYERGEIDTVLVVTLAPARGVWFDPELGELKKHLWPGTPARIYEFHQKWRRWDHDIAEERGLTWIVTNYEFLRSEPRLEHLEKFADSKTWLVLDESSAIKSHRAVQTKACLKLRIKCSRVTELNGTPVGHSPLDLYSQSTILSPLTKRGGSTILDCDTFTHFHARYAVTGGFQGKQTLGWQNLDDLTRRLKPYVLRRMKRDCLDLPPTLPPVALTVPLKPENWKIYKAMRDQLLAELQDGTIAIAAQAPVRVMRLAQITAGFVGGLQRDDPEPPSDGCIQDDPNGRPPWVHQVTQDRPGTIGQDQAGLDLAGLAVIAPGSTQEIGTEKTDLILDWIGERLDEDANLKLILWCRFRPQVLQLERELHRKLSRMKVEKLWGGLKPAEREQALRLMDPRTAPKGPAVLVGTTATGKMSFNFTASHHVLYASNDYSLMVRQQSEARVDRPGQLHPVWYGDVLATGPQGQKTVDHAIVKALRAKDDIAKWTTSRWVSVLREE
jgi:SNF2 family DNA or RNA helicase